MKRAKKNKGGKSGHEIRENDRRIKKVSHLLEHHKPNASDIIDHYPHPHQESAPEKVAIAGEYLTPLTIILYGRKNWYQSMKAVLSPKDTLFHKGF